MIINRAYFSQCGFGSKNLFESINSDDICKLAKKKFYLWDFIDQDIVTLEYGLIRYKLDVMYMFKAFILVEVY